MEQASSGAHPAGSLSGALLYFMSSPAAQPASQVCDHGTVHFPSQQLFNVPSEHAEEVLHAFANAMDSLLSDPDRARAMGAEGASSLNERHSKTVHLSRLEEALGLSTKAGRLSSISAS